MPYSHHCPRCACQRPIVRAASGLGKCLECDYEFGTIGVSKEIPLDEWQKAYARSQQRAQEQQRETQKDTLEQKVPKADDAQPEKSQPPSELPAVRLAKNPTGGVYLIKSGAHFKIGKANDFEQRIKQVKLQLPEKAIEVHRIYTDDPLGIESYWHRRFKEKRLNGEWFALNEEDVQVFKAREKM